MTQALEDELVQFSGSTLVSVKGSMTKCIGTSIHGNGQSNEACVNFQFSADKGRTQRFQRGKEFKNLETTCVKIISYAMNLNDYEIYIFQSKDTVARSYLANLSMGHSVGKILF